MVAGEHTTNQRKNLDKFTTLNNNVNQCFCGRSGARCQGQNAGGTWTYQDRKNHINVLELSAVRYAIPTFFVCILKRNQYTFKWTVSLLFHIW